MKLKHLITSSLGLLTSLQLAHANPNQFRFDQITVEGAGCSNSNTTIIPAPNQQMVSFLFDDLRVEVPQQQGTNNNDRASDENQRPSSRLNANLDHKICNMVIKATIPQGQMVDSLGITLDFRGGAFMAMGTRAIYKSYLMEWDGPTLANQRSMQLIARKLWMTTVPGRGPVEEDWFLSRTSEVKLNPGCAVQGDQQVTFVIQNILQAQILNSAGNPSALVTVDTADMGGQLKFHLNTRSCSGGGRVTPTVPTRPVRPGRG